ncbi:hypothetical protein J6590_076912 [Homalodisca vitripennis]|nr:hypothetical protein J6590_076912 [Homalodisca vitripennis]
MAAPSGIWVLLIQTPNASSGWDLSSKGLKELMKQSKRWKKIRQKKTKTATLEEQEYT